MSRCLLALLSLRSNGRDTTTWTGWWRRGWGLREAKRMRKARMRKARMGKARIIFDRIVLYLMAAIWLGSILGFTFHLLTQLIFLEKCTVYIVHCALGQTRAIPNPLIPTCSICLSPACEIFVFPSALFSQSIPICDPQTCFMPTLSHLWPSTWTHQAIYSPPSPNAGCKNVNPF